MITLTEKYIEGRAARSIPGAIFDPESRAWVLDEPTPRSAAVALRLFPGLAAKYPELAELRESLGQDVRPFDNATPYGKPIAAPRLRKILEELG